LVIGIMLRLSTTRKCRSNGTPSESPLTCNQNRAPHLLPEPQAATTDETVDQATEVAPLGTHEAVTTENESPTETPEVPAVETTARTTAEEVMNPEKMTNATVALTPKQPTYFNSRVVPTRS